MKETVELNVAVRVMGKQKPIAILTLDGYIDSTTAAYLKDELLSLGRDIDRFILNFSGVEYVSSAGWGVILARIKEHREKGGDIIFTKMIKEVFSIYQLLELDKVIKYFPNIEESLKNYGEITTAPIPEHAPPVREKKREEPKAKPEPAPPERPKKKNIEDAVRAIIADNPLLNSSQIKGRLLSREFGFEKLGRFTIYGLLRRLGLNTREKRLYYAWQAEKKAHRSK
jgi:anti-sigma B factor antagonist